MNRFEFSIAKLHENEAFVCKHRSVKIYDGNEKTTFEDGEIVLTTHRLFWGRNGEIARGVTTLSLKLKYIISLDEEMASSYVFGRKKRIIVHLKPPCPDKQPGPVDSSNAHFIKLSGKHGVEDTFIQAFYETISARVWEIRNPEEKEEDQGATEQVRKIKLRTGIVGIERSLIEKQKMTDENIAVAFQDLNKLMVMAREMVTISKAISSKIKERQGDISEDETVRFKSYLMSLGIDDPVTRENYSTNSDYYASLARQLTEMLLDPITEVGGMMSLTDVYCRVNRARGLELLSPEDLLAASQNLTGPIKLRQFPSGAMVLQLETHDDEVVAADTADRVEQSESMSVEELARILGISVLLAQERLLTAERAGKVCRDESIEGLRFFPNLFLIKNT